MVHESTIPKVRRNPHREGRAPFSSGSLQAIARVRMTTRGEAWDC